MIVTGDGTLMAFLVFDTATSRFYRDKTTHEEPQVLRLAWWRSDQPEPVCHLIRPPPGTTIDKATFPYHGLTLLDAASNGDVAADVVAELEKDAIDVDAIATFNADFHWRQLYRLMNVPTAKPPDKAVDVMAMAAPIVQIPVMRPGGGWKSPSLREACRFFDIKEPANLEHGPFELALSTVRAVRGVYEACMAHGTPSAA
jgi:hypothetical protein